MSACTILTTPLSISLYLKSWHLDANTELYTHSSSGTCLQFDTQFSMLVPNILSTWSQATFAFIAKSLCDIGPAMLGHVNTALFTGFLSLTAIISITRFPSLISSEASLTKKFSHMVESQHCAVQVSECTAVASSKR